MKDCTVLLEASEDDFAELIEDRAPRGLSLSDSALAPAPVLQMLGGLAQSIRCTFAPAAWMIVEDGGEIVGLCSITKLLDEGGIDIGYGIAPTRQGRGVATKAISALLKWAQNDLRVNFVTAETSVNNRASQRVLETNHFVRVGERQDAEDGELICWKFDLRSMPQTS